ncbi:MAG: DUF2958 domain-containing protein [Chloroflexi bacterium]|nr:DUF2958 domain-containing protein [Chloroflexota bacterium]
MNDEIRANLPPLITIEQLGMNAVATVKYFAPDSNWTWYAAAFDGEDIFYGLVIGYEVEFGSFSLSELSAVGGGLNLPIERDLYFQSTTLGALYRRHRPERGAM